MKEPSDFPTTHGRHVGPGTRLNGIYEIEGLIATGGMGEVYRGRAIETGIAVAIKMIRLDLAANETVLALFRKEAASLHNLLHDAIVRYYVFSTDPDLHRPYLAMEYVEGVALSDLLGRGPMSLADVSVLQRRIAAALDVAHRSGVIHRDLSPDNIILPQADPSRAKLIDFGIARSASGGETIIGDRFAGKINFASPEQVGLYGGQAGPKSDIYSLGLTLAAALTGSPLEMGGTQVDVVRKRQHVPKLEDIPAPFRPLLSRMLQPDPKDRPASMGEIAEWYPAGAAPSKARSAAQPKRRWVAPGAAAAILMVAGGLGYLGWTRNAGTLEPSGRAGSESASLSSVAPATPAPRSDAPVAPPASAPALPDDRAQALAGSAGGTSLTTTAPDVPVPAPADLPGTNVPPSGSGGPGPSDPGGIAAAPAPPPSPSVSALIPPVTVPETPGVHIPAAPAAAPSPTPGGLRDCATCPELVAVPEGIFKMGSRADSTEQPIRDVPVKAFLAGRFPVKVAEWRACVRDKACAFDPPGDGEAPVHNVSFDDAQQYAAWLTRTTGRRYRLLTEAEWEYAARGGSTTTYWWGDLFRSDRAACRTCSDPTPRNPPNVGRFPANGFGLADVTGSVAQWVQDCWHKDYRGAPRDASAWVAPGCRERVLRGGSWMSDTASLRLASREFYDAGVRYPGHGFRIARDR